MNERNRQLAEAREDERTRYKSVRLFAAREAAIREEQRLRMTERRDLVDRKDDTGFADDCFI